MALLLYLCPDDGGFPSRISGSPVPVGNELPMCRTGEGRWLNFSDQVQSEVQAWMDAHPPTPLDDAELIGVTPEGITAAIAFGFGTVVMFWFLGYIGAIALRAVKMA